MNNRVGIYLRLSREDERSGESSSIINQRELLLNYVKDHNLILVDEYVDDGVSGTTFNRIGFNKMLSDIKSKKINMVLTKDTSRLGRDHIEFGYYVEKFFPENNIRYVAITDGIDTGSNSINNDMLLFKSAYNDMYVKDISNKIRSILYNKKRNGQFVGQTAPYGYYKCSTNRNKLQIDIVAAKIIKRIYKMFLNGYSVTAICETLTNDQIPIPSVHKNMNRGLKSTVFGTWNQRTVSDILQNPTYMGDLTQGKLKKINYKSKKIVHTNKSEWIIAKDSCPAIINRKTFAQVQRLYQINRKTQALSNYLLLRGLIYCKECKHTIGFRKQIQNTKNGIKERIYGNCNYWNKHKKDQACTPHNVKYNTIEEIVMKELACILGRINLEKICEHLFVSITNDARFEKIDNMIQKKEQDIVFTKNKLNKCYNDYLDEIIDLEMYQVMKKNISKEIEIKDIELNELKKRNISNELSKIKSIICQEVEKIISMKNIDNKLLAMIISKIEIDKDNRMDIYYNIQEN